LNRMNDVIPATHVEGEVLIDGRDVYAAGTDVVDLRRRVGMVFQKSNPFPKSIFDNVAYGLRINRVTNSKSELESRVEQALKDAARVSDLTAFFLLGKLIEVNTTEKMCTAPDDKVTEDYITGRFG